MEVEFKDVNQGDSIILKWDDNGKKKVGLIDCHSDKGNPTLNYIKENSIEEIEFVIISHPHFDHFSGIVDLFNYCTTHTIPIHQLGFTFDTAITYAYANLTSNKAEGLLEFFEFLATQSKKRLTKNRTIKHSFPINSETNTKKFSEFEIDFLRPLQEQVMSIAKSYGKLLGETIKTEPDLNIYSSVLELRKEKKSILLTSDAPKNTFISLIKYYKTRPRNFHLVQIPHHGSIHNHHLEFWEKLRRIENCPSVFSVGEEAKDKLPNFQVVDEISKEGYDIFSTNIVYGIADHLKIKQKAKKPTIMKSSAIVRSKSKKVKKLKKYEGDKSFNF